MTLYVIIPKLVKISVGHCNDGHANGFTRAEEARKKADLSTRRTSTFCIKPKGKVR